MGRLSESETGRLKARHPCPSCQMRYKVGEPKANAIWPAQLAMTEQQVDLLLIAAAEFRDLCLDCDNCAHGAHGAYCPGDPLTNDWCQCQSYEARGGNDAIAFLDWVRPDALRPSFASPVNVQREAVSAAERRKVAG